MQSFTYILYGVNEIEDTKTPIGAFHSEEAAWEHTSRLPDGETPFEHESRIAVQRSELRAEYGSLACTRTGNIELDLNIERILDEIAQEISELTKYQGGTFDDFVVESIPILDK